MPKIKKLQNRTDTKTFSTKRGIAETYLNSELKTQIRLDLEKVFYLVKEKQNIEELVLDIQEVYTKAIKNYFTALIELGLIDKELRHYIHTYQSRFSTLDNEIRKRLSGDDNEPVEVTEERVYKIKHDFLNQQKKTEISFKEYVDKSQELISLDINQNKRPKLNLNNKI